MRGRGEWGGEFEGYRGWGRERERGVEGKKYSGIGGGVREGGWGEKEFGWGKLG